MRKSVMEHRFSNVPTVSMPRSTFDRSHGHKTTFDSSDLVPLLLEEIYPGDTVNCSLSALMRLSTPTHPIMDNIFMDFFAFFVPNRLVWSNWKKFMGETYPDPDSSIAYTIPVITMDTDRTTGHGTLFDYMGVPLIDYATSNYTINALPFRGYARIWNEWFRDQNLQDSNDAGMLVDDGPDSDSTASTWYGLQKRGKRHDYFTSALPWLQKGTAVSLPLGTSAEIHVDSTPGTGKIGVYNDTTGAVRAVAEDGSGYSVTHSTTTAEDGLYADLSTATAATINEIRQAFQVQRLLERDARSGTRYIELVKQQFGVDSPDARQQRPEFLGSSSVPININPVADSTGTNIGDLGAFGTGYGQFQFVKSFTEHGFLFVLASARADLSYQEGMHKMWKRSTRYDYYTPVLAHLGEQAILERELFIDDATITAGTDDDAWGYQERWAELRYAQSKITGMFRGNYASTLEAWHLSEDFGSAPTLNAAFIEDSAKTMIDRAIVTSSEPHWLFDGYFNMKHTRVMPVYSVPGMIDHN